MEKTMDDVKQTVGDNLEDIREQLDERAQEIRDTITNFVDAQPLAAVGIAFGVGYLLSGALFSRATFKMAHLGWRIALGGFLKQLVGGIVPGMLIAALAGGHERGGEQQRPSSSSSGRTGGNGNANRT